MSTLILDAETHTYTYDGKPVIGTTELMSLVGARKSKEDPWRSASGAEFIIGGDVSREFGKILHMIAVLMIKGKKFTYDPKMEPWVQGLLKFFADHSYLKTCSINGVPAIEYGVYSSKYRFAGTFDWLAENGINLYLIDWKSSTAPAAHWHEQTAAYEQCISETIDIRGRRLHRWPVMIKENDYRIISRKGHPEDWYNFLSMLNTYRLITKG